LQTEAPNRSAAARAFVPLPHIDEPGVGFGTRMLTALLNSAAFAASIVTCFAPELMVPLTNNTVGSH